MLFSSHPQNTAYQRHSLFHKDTHFVTQAEKVGGGVMRYGQPRFVAVIIYHKSEKRARSHSPPLCIIHCQSRPPSSSMSLDPPESLTKLSAVDVNDDVPCDADGSFVVIFMLLFIF